MIKILFIFKALLLSLFFISLNWLFLSFELVACQNKQSEKRHGSKNSRPLKITISCCQCCPGGSVGREKVIDRCAWSTLENTYVLAVKSKLNCHHSYYLVPFFYQNIQYNNSKLIEQFLFLIECPFTSLYCCFAFVCWLLQCGENGITAKCLIYNHKIKQSVCLPNSSALLVPRTASHHGQRPTHTCTYSHTHFTNSQHKHPIA